MVCFSRLASPSLEYILDLLPLVDLLRSVFLCRLFALDHVPAALRRRRHLKLLICPSSPSGLRLWATLPIDPLAIYRIRDIQQRQRQQMYDWNSKPGDDGSVRGFNLLVLTQLTPSTTLGLLDAFPLLVSLTFVQCAVSVATTVQLIVLLKSAWSTRLETLKLYLNQYPELGLLRTDSLLEEDLLLDWNRTSRTGGQRLGPNRNGFLFPEVFRQRYPRGDRIYFWEREATKRQALGPERVFAHLRQGETEVHSVLRTLWSSLATSLTGLRKLSLHTDVARYGTFGGPSVLYQTYRGPLAFVVTRHKALRAQLHLSPAHSVRSLHLHLDGVNSDQREVIHLLEAQLRLLQERPDDSPIASIHLTTPLTFIFLEKLLEPENRQFTRRFTALALIRIPHFPPQRFLQFLGSFVDYFSNLRSLSLLALRPGNLAALLGQCSRLNHLRHLTMTWSNIPPLRFPDLEEPPRGLPVLGTVTTLTLYYLGAITDGHGALQPLLSHWEVTGPAFPKLTSFAFHVIGEYQCEDCQIQEQENPASGCKRLLASSLAAHAPVLKSFKMISQWEERITKGDEESDNEETNDYDLPQTITRYNFTEINDF